VIGGLIAVLIAAGLTAFVYGEYLWFDQLGYEGVFLTILGIRLALFVAVAVLVGTSMYASYRVARPKLASIGAVPPRPVLALALGGVPVLAGWYFSSSWQPLIRFLNSTSFGVSDPVFGHDVAFYAFLLPVLRLSLTVLQVAIAVALVLAVGLYARPFFDETRSPEDEYASLVSALAFIRRNAYSHVVVLAGALFTLQGLSFALNRYELLFSSRGLVFGVGATDAAITLPFLTAQAVVGVLGGVAVMASGRLGDARAAYIPIAALIGLVLLGGVAGAGHQALVVSPDEYNKEEQYLRHEIDFTNRAFALDRVDEQEFPVSETLTRDQIEANPGTIDNIRLWDPRPLLTTYNELQIFRTYYQFTDVDIDRYEVNGEERQVMVSARELEFDALPPESQTWVNRHLVYTHGFGLAMSPVSEITSDGLPEFYIKDIPPNSTVGIDVTQPRIYYGETTDDYAIVNSGTRELDYPSGGENVYTRYDGGGGVPLSSSTRKAIFALKFGDPQIFLSDSVTTDSRIQFDRDIGSRAPKIAPFLEYDRDPYIVTSNGKLYWIYDAYTTTANYPYSDRVSFKGSQANYVRNSVKVVVDAHTGETTYYAADPDDPVIRTWRSAFPDLFVDLDRMPEHLRSHLRYPEDAFRVQANQYLTYHMKDTQVFYNKEDAWRIPNEVARGVEISMEPYYVIMSFPETDAAEFVMIQPYIPEGRQNMIGWLAARSDPPNYGSMKSYLFSKQRLIFGPMQIESRIDQDARISQQITLWSESGSSVIRGNLLAIPIENTILYVEPLFLESREQGALPELKRTILVHGDRVTMQPSLPGALAVLVGAGGPEPPGPVPGGGLSPADLERAQRLYEEARSALRSGDLGTYADRIEELGGLLSATEAGNATAAPG
jgi:uncharacterized membrane protein (UPF0182 family)